MTILACDPGGTTGWASYENGDVQCGQLTPEAFCRMVTNTRNFGKDLLVVTEDFIPRGGTTTWQPDALHIIGFLRFTSEQSGWDFHKVLPGVHKKWSTDEKLKKIGWWKPGQDHARDALRVLLWWLCTKERNSYLLERLTRDES